MIMLTICIYQSFSSRLITVQTSLLQTIVVPIYTIFTKLCKYSARSADHIIWYSQIIPLMYPQMDKPSSRNTIAQNYVNSLREMQISNNSACVTGHANSCCSNG